MAFCTKCGNRIPDDSAFCTACGQPTGAAPQNGQQNNAAPSFTPPSNNNGVPNFTPPAGNTPPANNSNSAPTFNPPAENKGAPTFTPPAAPTFTPPAQTFTPPSRSFNGPSCYYHTDEPAVASCARCGKYLCQDCFDSYGVSSGEYAGNALCYDCTKELVAENVEILKQNKSKITVTFVAAIIGMVIGGIIGIAVGSSAHAGFGGTLLFFFLFAMIGGSFWTFLKNWFIRIGAAMEGGGCNLISLAVGIIIGGVIEEVLSIYRTIRKVIECIVYLKRTSGFIESDSQALQQMDDYMEYTLVRNKNRGVDIETLLQQNSQLANNSVAQMARTQSEEEIEANMRNCVATINENGEIIRNFAA